MVEGCLQLRENDRSLSGYFGLGKEVERRCCWCPEMSDVEDMSFDEIDLEIQISQMIACFEAAVD